MTSQGMRSQSISAQSVEGFATHLVERETEVGVERAFWFAEVPSVYAITRAASLEPGRYWRPEGRAALAHETRQPMSLYALAERRVDELHEEMGRQLRDLSAKNTQLQEMNRVRVAYLADIAHELRNSLLTLSFYVELMTKGRNAKQEHYQRLALQSVERLRHFIEDTLSLSSLEYAGARRGEMLPVDLNALIGEVVLLHQPQAEAAGLSLCFEAAHDLPLVEGDTRLLLQVIVNLVTNAIKYTKAGRIQVKTLALPASNEVIMDVTDSGIGIAASDLPYIFERFYRAQDEQVNDIAGTGLGLAIVKEIVDLHQGEITVDSMLGAGSRFRVRLPSGNVK